MKPLYRSRLNDKENLKKRLKSKSRDSSRLKKLAYTQVEFLSFIQLAEIGGIWILTFLNSAAILFKNFSLYF